MNKLILIKHAKPEVNPSQLPELWSLSEQGKTASNHLASVLQHAGITNIVSSEEIKAIETAQILASAWNLTNHTAPDLHEHDRSNVPHMRSGEFISHVELFFRRPTELMLGKETAQEALARFEGAVRKTIDAYAGQTIAIVSHGTVISLLVAKLADRNPFELWRAMQLPSYVEIDTESWTVEKMVDRI